MNIFSKTYVYGIYGYKYIYRISNLSAVNFHSYFFVFTLDLFKVGALDKITRTRLIYQRTLCTFITSCHSVFPYCILIHVFFKVLRKTTKKASLEKKYLLRNESIPSGSMLCMCLCMSSYFKLWERTLRDIFHIWNFLSLFAFQDNNDGVGGDDMISVIIIMVCLPAYLLTYCTDVRICMQYAQVTPPLHNPCSSAFNNKFFFYRDPTAGVPGSPKKRDSPSSSRVRNGKYQEQRCGCVKTLKYHTQILMQKCCASFWNTGKVSKHIFTAVDCHWQYQFFMEITTQNDTKDVI